MKVKLKITHAGHEIIEAQGINLIDAWYDLERLIREYMEKFPNIKKITFKDLSITLTQ